MCLLDEAMHGFGVLGGTPVYWLCLGLLNLPLHLVTLVEASRPGLNYVVFNLPNAMTL